MTSIFAPNHSHLFAAIGSALNSKKDTPMALLEMQKRLEGKIKMEFEVERLDLSLQPRKTMKNFPHAMHSIRFR